LNSLVIKIVAQRFSFSVLVYEVLHRF
jgi:hypothetical protein